MTQNIQNVVVVQSHSPLTFTDDHILGYYGILYFTVMFTLFMCSVRMGLPVSSHDGIDK